MKRTILVFAISFLILLSVVMWFYSSGQYYSATDAIQFGIILLLVVFAMFIGYKRLKSAKRGEPVEDELSKKILLRTASTSYYISLYIWVFILFIKDRISYDTEELIGYGILGMALSFAICWLLFNFRGIRHD